MDKQTVSILMPCYNSELTISRAIQSVMNQTYRPIELILVNDGATDDSHQIIESMKSSILAAGIDFKYIVQENKGLGGAINEGLKHFTGDYLAWIDSDDELLPTSIEKKVRFLQENTRYQCVSTNAFIVNGNDWENPVGLLVNNTEIHEKENQFYELLMSRSIFCAGCHLIKTEAFLHANPTRSIYPSRVGQNWQMLLPVYYHFKRGFINEPLYKYGIYENNMTAQLNKMNGRKMYERKEEYIRIIQETLKQIPNMNPHDREHYEKDFISKTTEENLYVAIGEKDLASYIKFLVQLLKLGKIKMDYIVFPIKLIFRKIFKRG